ncbi:hypothetical protein ACT7DP_07250 [Bacillus paranthracis]
MTKIYSNIFLVNNINSLSSLDEVFRRQHSELLTHVKKDENQVAGMCDSEKKFHLFLERDRSIRRNEITPN